MKLSGTSNFTGFCQHAALCFRNTVHCYYYIVCILFSQPILGDVPKSFVAPQYLKRSFFSRTKVAKSSEVFIHKCSLNPHVYLSSTEKIETSTALSQLRDNNIHSKGNGKFAVIAQLFLDYFKIMYTCVVLKKLRLQLHFYNWETIIFTPKAMENLLWSRNYFLIILKWLTIMSLYTIQNEIILNSLKQT